jgi:hypothetical protein
MAKAIGTARFFGLPRTTSEWQLACFRGGFGWRCFLAVSPKTCHQMPPSTYTWQPALDDDSGPSLHFFDNFCPPAAMPASNLGQHGNDLPLGGGLRYNIFIKSCQMPQGDAMKTEIQIVDQGRGPQLSTTRITVLDVFYYLHRGYQFDAIQQIMPALSREEFDVVVEYVKANHDQLVQSDRRAEQFIRRSILEQTAKGLSRTSDESVPLEQRLARLKEKMRQRIAEKNGEGHPG